MVTSFRSMTMSWGLPATVFYLFNQKEQYLQEIILNLQMPGDAMQAFKVIEETIRMEFGPMSPAKQNDQFYLYTDRKAGGTGIIHGLRIIPGQGIVHQVIYYKANEDQG